MPHYGDYRCTRCQRKTLRELLVVKKVIFTEMGAGAKVLKSRTREWLCDECIVKDDDYISEPFTSSPGMKSPALERVREAEAGTSRQI